MTGILNIATLGLNAFQTALQVTSNNIANVGNKAYTRQTIEFASVTSRPYAGYYIGEGVTISSIIRNSDHFATEQMRDTVTAKTQYDTFYQQAIQVDKLLSMKGTSIATSLENFFNSLSQLNATPDSIASRDLMLQQSKMLAEQFGSLQLRLDEYQQNNNRQIDQAVNQINQITTHIAKLNTQLAMSPDAPELLDSRDELLQELAKYTAITVIDQGPAGIGVSVGNGNMIVMGGEQRNLAVNMNQHGQFDTQIVLLNGAGQIDITSNLKTGMLGGLLGFEEDVLSYGSQLLGQMAIGLATAFNSQHQLGMDMNNQIGMAFFTDYNQTNLQLARSLPSVSNTGTGALSVAISDISQIRLSDYKLVVSDAATNQITITRQSDGNTTVLNWTDTPPAPPAGQVVVDGMTITVDNIANLADNDSYTLIPTSGAARDLTVNISDPRAVAVAAPVRTLTSINNNGTGSITLDTVFNTSLVNKEYQIQIISPTEYNLVNITDSVTTGPFTFTPNMDNTIMIPDINPSYSVKLSGIPQVGDTFTATYNAEGFGDNRNGTQLAGLRQNQFFTGGTESLFDRYSDLITQVAGTTYQAKVGGEAADILYQQAVDFRDSKSAVNLDEEGGNLVRFEQAYQAASRLLAVSNQIMDALFAAMR
ncbi:flagellar hook-associated protein FlgK [Legionella fairfieldensis]|uniref:flagellar hook-associated protein FlgK n=1 Tax=Legionella fairfieldensis TaxID=45064 RepID=UPI00049191F9|nr:flagellar hook-associated protein FlgK [Legionella fairfieldensis]